MMSRSSRTAISAALTSPRSYSQKCTQTRDVVAETDLEPRYFSASARASRRAQRLVDLQLVHDGHSVEEEPVTFGQHIGIFVHFSIGLWERIEGIPVAGLEVSVTQNIPNAVKLEDVVVDNGARTRVRSRFRARLSSERPHQAARLTRAFHQSALD